MCCAPKKRKPANLKKELRPAKIAEAPPRDKITRSYVTPPIVKNTTPKWRKEHETKLKENAEAQELEKQKLITQNWIRKREAMDKFQRYLELNKTQTAQTVKEDEPSRHFENVLVWRETHPPALRPVRKQKPEANTTRQPKFRSSSFLDYDQISLRPNKSSVSKARSSSSRGDRISLKEFYHYIKNSIPDKKIYRQMYSTDKTDLNSKTSNQSISDRTSRTAGSIISTTSIAQSMLAKPKQGESKDEKVKSCQSQYLIGLNLREQWRPDLYIDERTSVENRIKELMKEVSIRQDFQPLRPPRDFITENILRIGLLKRNKKSDTKAKVKQREKYPTLNEVLTVPGDHTMRFSKRDQPKTIRIRRYSKGLSKGHLDPYQSRNPKSPPEESACSLTERRKCDCYICSLFLKGKEQKDSPLIQKAKVQRRRYELRSYYQKMRRRERELEQEQCCEKIC
ncbi:uncharacterized protein LOC108106236 [Drosophila eugracilis]|uniref:uncharacterized protein LOC108106236 n=1 Tax=Drosophila eugracilis TaxID=29029 RepID=UPI001BDA09EA|nr:uncharacterized protein LOC108106236 [Drosophila eugracilis]